MRNRLLGILAAVISKPLLSGSHDRLLMSKNFSDVNARSFPFLMSISTKPNSFAVFSDCPPAKATDFPSGEILLAPIRKGAGRDAHFLAFFRHYWILVKF